MSSKASSPESAGATADVATRGTALTGSDDYRVLANALPQIIWTTDANGRLEWVNDRWYEFTGLTEEESLYNKGALVVIHPDDQAELQRIWLHALETSTACEIEYRIRRHDGAYRWHLARTAPVRGANGVITRWVSAVMDMHERRIAEAELRESERRFEAVFNLIPRATAVIRLSDGVHLQINEAFTQMTGFTRDDVVGQSTVTLGLWTAEERATSIAPLITPPGGNTLLSLRTKDGRPLRLAVSSTHINFGGDPCMIIVGIDVTAQEADEAALRRGEAQARARADELAALMDAVPAAVWISRDSQCLDIRGNRAAYEMLRVEPSENMYEPAIKRNFTFFIDGVEVPVDQLPLERAARGEVVRQHEEEVRFEDGQVRHLYGSAITLRDAKGAPRGAIGAYTDVTRLKEAESALRAADRRKDEFLALLSHELRNPLAPILFSAEVLKRRADAEAHADLDVIIRQARHLARLVDDLLDISMVASGKVTLTKRRIELSTVVARAVEVTGPLLEKAGHRLHVAVPLVGLAIDADEVRLTQVVNNLLANAARYTPSDGIVEITAAREHGGVVLRVRDSGIGIDPTLIPELFEMFVQGNRGADRAQGGLGLGLALVRSLTELHGGTVMVRSDGPGRGSEFIVRLPAAVSARDGNSTSPKMHASPSPARRSAVRVLLVDDNHDVVASLGRLLTIAGYETRIATDPLEALAEADTFRPQVAILDIGLPTMDGYRLARELRALLTDAPPALIALTGYGRERDREQSQEAGFFLHLVKPVDFDELHGALQLATVTLA